ERCRRPPTFAGRTARARRRSASRAGCGRGWPRPAARGPWSPAAGTSTPGRGRAGSCRRRPEASAPSAPSGPGASVADQFPDANGHEVRRRVLAEDVAYAHFLELLHVVVGDHAAAHDDEPLLHTTVF